jgi:hypothetical protein
MQKLAAPDAGRIEALAFSLWFIFGRAKVSREVCNLCCSLGYLIIAIFAASWLVPLPFTAAPALTGLKRRRDRPFVSITSPGTTAAATL